MHIVELLLNSDLMGDFGDLRLAKRGHFLLERMVNK